MKRLLLIILALCLPCSAQFLSNNIITTDRAIDWTQAGIAGGLPDGSWTQCGSTVAAYGSAGSPASAATINSAIAACTANHFVLLGAGTFYLNTSINFGGKSHVVLRGSGANSTFIEVYGTTSSGTDCSIFPQSGFICGTGSGASLFGGINQSPWTASYAQGAGAITLTSTTGIATVGSGTPSILFLTQCNTGFSGFPCSGSSVDNGTYFTCSAEYESGPTGCSDSGASGLPGNWNNRWQYEMAVATAVNGGTGVVNITPPLQHPNWASGLTPYVWSIPTSMVQTGVENLSVDLQNNASIGFAVQFYACYQCWISGIRVTNLVNFGIGFNSSVFYQIQNNYIYNGTAGNDPYAIRMQGFTGNGLIVNNIIQAVRTPLAFDVGPESGTVVAYNFAINDQQPFDNMSQAYWDHWSGNDLHLWESNIGAGLAIDQIHGTHLNESAFRNFMTGWESCANGNCGTFTAKDFGTVAFSYRNANRYGNVMGNIMGTPGYTTHYKTLTTQANGNAGYSMILGTGNGATSPPIPDDPLVGPSTLLWGNWDVTSNAIRWCGNSSDTGWSTTCSSTSETAGSAPTYPNAVPTLGDTGASQSVMPPSFYYNVGAKSSCGTGISFWKNPTSGTCPPWPPIGPDVSSGNVGQCAGTLNTAGHYSGVAALSSSQCTGTSLNTAWAGHVNAIPAMVCYLNTMGGPPDGTGNALAFNAAACYANDPSGSNPAFSYAPNPVAFGNVNVGSSGGPTTVTITNNGTGGTLTIGTLGSPSDAEYSISSNTCNGASLGVSSTCTFAVTFSPTTAGSKPATISVPDNVGNPDTVTLSGTGVATGPTVQLVPTSINFGNETVFTTSSGQTTTLTNVGNATLNISSIAASAHYSITSNTCGSTLVANASCVVTVTFSPVAIGVLSGTLTFTTNASTSPDVVSLTGTGVVLSYVSGGCSAYTASNGLANPWTFTCTPNSAGDAIVFQIACRPTSGVVTATTLTASGWTFTQLFSATSAATGMVVGLYGAIAPSASPTTFTATFTGGADCGSFGGNINGEFAGNNTLGGAITFNATGASGNSSGSCNQTAANVTPPLNNEAVWYGCQSAATGISSPWTLGVTALGPELSEYQILSGNSGVAQTPAFVGGTYYVVQGVAIAPITQGPGPAFGLTVGIGANVGW